MVIKFGKPQDNSLDIIRSRAVLYNKLLYKHTLSPKGCIPVPITNLKKLKKNFNSIEEYIRSNKKWIKLRDFDESEFSFGNYVYLMITKWENIKIILNLIVLPKTPIFDIIISPKLKNIYLALVEEELKIKQMNINRVVQNSTIGQSFDQEKYFLNYYSQINVNMSIKEILSIFKRDFSDEFVFKVEQLINKGLPDNKVLKSVDEF
jgi:uncharacterized protein YqfB (UPF0267 family)